MLEHAGTGEASPRRGPRRGNPGRALETVPRRQVRGGLLEQVPRGLRDHGLPREPPAQLPLPLLECLGIVRVLDPHVVRRAHGRLPVQELHEILPARGLSGERVRHLDREAPADEEGLPLLHVPLVEAPRPPPPPPPPPPPMKKAFHSCTFRSSRRPSTTRDTLSPYVGLMYCRNGSRVPRGPPGVPPSPGPPPGAWGAAAP